MEDLVASCNKYIVDNINPWFPISHLISHLPNASRDEYVVYSIATVYRGVIWLPPYNRTHSLYKHNCSLSANKNSAVISF